MEPSTELVGSVTRSTNRVAALGALLEGPQTRPGLQDTAGIPRATLSRILADFRKRDHDSSLALLKTIIEAEVEAEAKAAAE